MINKKLIALSASALALALPVVALAVDYSIPNTTNVAITALIDAILVLTWQVFVGIAVVMFIVAGVSFLTAKGDPESVGKARMFVIYGSVGIVVAILAFSVAAILKTTFGL